MNAGPCDYNDDNRKTLCRVFIKVSGYDNYAEGNYNEGPALIPVDIIDYIGPHPRNKTKTFIKCRSGHPDAYIDEPFEIVERRFPQI